MTRQEILSTEVQKAYDLPIGSIQLLSFIMVECIDVGITGNNLINSLRI